MGEFIFCLAVLSRQFSVGSQQSAVNSRQFSVSSWQFYVGWRLQTDDCRLMTNKNNLQITIKLIRNNPNPFVNKHIPFFEGFE